MKTCKLLLAIAALTTPALPAWGYAAAPEEDVAFLSAYLSYPTAGAVGVAPDIHVFVVEVTAVELTGPNGEELPALLDPSVPSVAGSVFVPIDDLGTGLWHVMAVPSANASNFSGEGVAIDLGTFTVGGGGDTEAPFADLQGATWFTGSDSITVNTVLSGQAAGEPVRFDIDLGDRDTLMDGVVDGTGGWTQSGSFSLGLGGTVTQIDPETATVRVRVSDIAGNVGEWSGPRSFDLVSDVDGPSGCQAAPGSVGGSWGVLLLVVGVGLAGLRRRRRAV